MDLSEAFVPDTNPDLDCNWYHYQRNELQSWRHEWKNVN